MTPTTLPVLPQASSLATQVDGIFFALLGLELLMVLGLFGLIIGFAIHYRRGTRVRRVVPASESRVEIAWSIGLLVLFLGIFAVAARLYVVQTTPPPVAVEIHALAKQWMWKFQHPGGRGEINELHLPLGMPVKVILGSEDVIHSLFVPAFRSKLDVVPGRLRTVWFTPTRIGRYHLFCAEYCGLDHARMRGEVVVMEPAEYLAWLSGARASRPGEYGRLARINTRWDTPLYSKSHGFPGNLTGETPVLPSRRLP